MKSLIALAILLGLVAGDEVKQAFQAALAKYADKDKVNVKTEDRSSMLRRFKSFSQFHGRVKAINNDDSRLFTAEDNFLSILTPEEIQTQHMGLNLTSLINSQDAVQIAAQDDYEDVPENRDFSGVISDVKDQGTCGSCWTFGATAALEGEIFFTSGARKVSLSEQEYVDCARHEYWGGCSGGWMEWAYTYSKESGRIAPESAYPYKEKDSWWCTANGRANALEDNNVKVNGFIRIQGDENLLSYASKHIVTVAVHANTDFEAYSKGLYTDNYCQEQVNHAVAVVGYGDNRGNLYWKVRNSWGSHWGDKGYMYMDRSIDNLCYISSAALIPEVACREDATCVAPDPNEADTSGDEEMEDWEDEGNNDNEECNTAGGMVLCKDCNCCRHKHFCTDPVDPEEGTEWSEWSSEWSEWTNEWSEWSTDSSECDTYWDILTNVIKIVFNFFSK